MINWVIAIYYQFDSLEILNIDTLIKSLLILAVAKIANYPRFAINPNTCATQELYSYQYLMKYIANNTVLVGPKFPSYIILPRPV